MEGSRLLQVLARGLSQATANLLAASLGLGPIHCQVQLSVALLDLRFSRLS
jgi:hypothetical protein